MQCIFVLYFLFFFISEGIEKRIFNIFGFYFFIIVIAAIIGYFGPISNINIVALFGDIKPLLSFSIILFFAYTINTKYDVLFTIKLLKAATIFLVLLHLVLIIIFKTYLNSNFEVFYKMLNTQNFIDNGMDSGEFPSFLFKGEAGYVNYIGDIYMGIGFILYENMETNRTKKLLLLMVISLAIILTGTRGFIISLVIVYLIKWLLLKKNLKFALVLVSTILILIPFYMSFIQDIGDKDLSDLTRYIQINQVFQQVTPFSFFFGHGFGQGVPIRPFHMELSLLEIFHKQGILGMSFWVYLIYVSYFLYKKVNSNLSLMFFMFIVFVYVISLTNPYMNHPLGLTMIALSLSSLLVLKKFKQI